MRGLLEIPTPSELLLGCPTIVRIFFLRNNYPKFPADALNRLCPSYFKKPRVDPATYKDPDPRILAKDARHLSKYIFPSQYGLSNVFVFANRKESYKQPDYSDREQEIKVRVSLMFEHEFNVRCRSLATVTLPSVSRASCR